MGMESKNARFLRQGIVELCRKMTPARRVKAFLEHSRAVKHIHLAGARRRNALLEKISVMTEKQEGLSSPQMLDQVGRILEDHHLDWAAIGGMAVAYHGVFGAGLEADALISLEDTGMDMDALARILSAQGWSVDTRMGEAGDPLEFVLRVTDGNANQVNLIGGIARLNPDFFKRSIEDEIDGMKLRFATPEDLIALKIYAGGPQDLEDVKGILAVQEGAIDKGLILSLCRRFGASAVINCNKLAGI
jgi:predicted nucleotidyltransferase